MDYELTETQEEINREPLSPACAAVLAFLYEWIHLNLKAGRCAQKDLTVGINFNLERLQEAFRLNAHEVGRVASIEDGHCLAQLGAVGLVAADHFAAHHLGSDGC